MRFKSLSRKWHLVNVSWILVLLVVFVTACARRDSTSLASQTPKTSPAVPASKSGPEGQTLNWQLQGMTFTLPADWQSEPVQNESEEFRLNGPDGGSLHIDVMDDQRTDDIDSALQKEYDNLKQAGVVDDVRLLELDGAKGIVSIQTETTGSERTTGIRWNGYRKFNRKLAVH